MKRVHRLSALLALCMAAWLGALAHLEIQVSEPRDVRELIVLLVGSLSGHQWSSTSELSLSLSPVHDW